MKYKYKEYIYVCEFKYGFAYCYFYKLVYIAFYDLRQATTLYYLTKFTHVETGKRKALKKKCYYFFGQ